ncbi:MAG TPA: hypothetical protein VHU15_16270 [Stellaceae bacterium]|jgi:heme oxygenase|nr:hypothetical protein [Stellaceae bacterium]
MSRDSRLIDSKRAEQALRDQRLARALRENLRRRKEQARQRDTAANGAAPGEPEPHSGKPRA